MEKKEKEKDLWLKVFCLNARCLTDEEVAALPEENRKMAETAGLKGVWLALNWEPGMDTSEQQSISVPGTNMGAEKEEGRCVVEQPSELA